MSTSPLSRWLARRKTSPARIKRTTTKKERAPQEPLLPEARLTPSETRQVGPLTGPPASDVAEMLVEGKVDGRTLRRLPDGKRRTSALSLSVSPEEAALLRRYAAMQGLSFSEWARSSLFRTMGHRQPARPKES